MHFQVPFLELPFGEIKEEINLVEPFNPCNSSTKDMEVAEIYLLFSQHNISKLECSWKANCDSDIPLKVQIPSYRIITHNFPFIIKSRELFLGVAKKETKGYTFS